MPSIHRVIGDDKMGHGYNWNNQREVSQNYRLNCSLKTYCIWGLECPVLGWVVYHWTKSPVLGLIFYCGRKNRNRALIPGPVHAKEALYLWAAAHKGFWCEGGVLSNAVSSSSHLTSMFLNFKSGIQTQNGIKWVLAGYVRFVKANTRWQHSDIGLWIRPNSPLRSPHRAPQTRNPQVIWKASVGTSVREKYLKMKLLY